MTQKFGLLFAAAAMVATSFALPLPAMAQGTLNPTPKSGSNCPTGWSTQSGAATPRANTCFPFNDAAKPMYVRNGNSCAAGYGQDEGYCVKGFVKPNLDGEGASGRIAKSVPGNRCPVAYVSDLNLKSCYAEMTNPPVVRARGAAPCRAGELEEWGLYCTSNTAGVTLSIAKTASTRDLINIAQYTGKAANQGEEINNTPTMIKLFGGGGASSSNSSSNESSASTPAPQQQANCGAGSASGAALGAALGGQAGAAIGAMMGGFGKPKKPAGC